MFLQELLEEKLTGVTLIYGGAGSGKTTICLQHLADRSSYVSTGRNFNVERLTAMRADAQQLISKLALFEPRSLEELEAHVRSAVALSPLCSVLVVDSLAALLRTADRKLANLALHRILDQLGKAACPVLLTSELYDRPSGSTGALFVGGDMLRLSCRTIIELRDGVASVRKHPVHTGRAWPYRITAAGLEATKTYI